MAGRSPNSGGPRGLSGFSGMRSTELGPIEPHDLPGNIGRGPGPNYSDGMFTPREYPNGPTVQINPGGPTAQPVANPNVNQRPNVGGSDIANWASGQQGANSPWGVFGAPLNATSWGYANPQGTLHTSIPTYWGQGSGRQGAWNEGFGGAGGGYSPGGGMMGMSMGGLSAGGMGGTYIAQALRSAGMPDKPVSLF